MIPETEFWPEKASPEYRAARSELLRAEQDLRDAIERVAAQRRALPEGAELPPYTFTEGPTDLGSDGPLSRPTLLDLFGDQRNLIIYHMMFGPRDEQACEMCSMWLDGFNGIRPHVEQNAAFVAVAKAPIDKVRAWARRRGWTRLRLLSSHDSTFNTDLRVEDPSGDMQFPAISVLVRDGDTVRHFYTMQAIFPTDESGRGLDLYCPVWQILDLLPGGRGEWYASNDYGDGSPCAN
ncbi:DUF899 family protein [Micromonospora sp. CPCC 206060]|uniref:DUF899 family protein n=1 Tax=Micromonospora sp. CPCC 206060 TaxID=3122406 RepID=UPI002FF1734A